MSPVGFEVFTAVVLKILFMSPVDCALLSRPAEGFLERSQKIFLYMYYLI
jgi:hypothetical protein